MSDSFASGSSLMPQKKNPDAAELLRAKAPRVVGRLAGLHGVLHGLPLTYNKDLQEDKEPLFDAIDTLELRLRVARAMLAGIEFDRERMAAAASDELIAATDVADLLVRQGVPFREAHGIVGGVVRAAVERGKPLSELTDDELRRARPAATSRGVPGAARAELVARVEGLRRRHLARARARPARSGAARAGGGAGLRLEQDFYARSVHDVARDLIGCVVRHGETAGPHRRDRELPHGRARLPRLRRRHAAHRDAVRPAGRRLRVLLVRHPLAAERGLRGARASGRRC